MGLFFNPAKKSRDAVNRNLKNSSFQNYFFNVWVLLSLFYFLSLSHISEKSESSHHAKIVNCNAFSEFLQMVPKHNFIGPFKLFLFIGYSFYKNFQKALSQEKSYGERAFWKFLVMNLQTLKGNVHIIRNNFWGRGVWRFLTKPCKDIGICTVFCYEGGGGSENLENRVTYYVDVPKLNLKAMRFSKILKFWIREAFLKNF